MKTNNISRNGSFIFFGFLFIVFLILKLTNVIVWSWWWVTSPLWFGIAIILACYIILCLTIIISSLIHLIIHLLN
jgi:hypothetical protein